MMENILTRQNREENINRLCAQKQLYIKAKRIFILQIILAVPVTVLLSLTKVILGLFSVDVSSYVLVYGMSLSLMELLLINLVINDLKKTAAKVQESFDCLVYEMEWNNFIVGKKPSKEVITRNANEFKASGGDVSKLADWYPIEFAHLPLRKSILLCQKTNLNYDISIREAFKKRVLIVAGITLVVLVICTLIGDLSFQDFITRVVASFLPVFILATKIVIENNKTMKNAEELRAAIETLLEDESSITDKALRSVQDKLYLSRKDGALIPEFFYDKIRDRLEKEMHDNAAAF
jgi:hypothetical protein